MSMSTPSLYQRTAFDATHDAEFTFAYVGDQAFKNRLVIRNNVTNAIVYNQLQTTMQLKHTVPANSLTNGVYYNAEVTVYNSADTASPTSAKIQFHCYTSPSWNFANLSANQVIGNSSYGLQLSYSQSEGELLNSYQVKLYDSGQHELWASGLKYNTTNLLVTVANLEEDTQYYLKALGTTKEGMSLDTGFISVSVAYIHQDAFTRIELDSLDTQGMVKIQSNIISITGTCTANPPVYIDGSKIDLRTNGVRVDFAEGFNIVKDFTIHITGYDFNDNTTILIMSNGTYQVTLKYCKGTLNLSDGEKVYLYLEATSSSSPYVLYSNTISAPLGTDIIYIFVRRINNIYQLYIENKGSE